MVPDHYLHLPIHVGVDVIGRLTLTIDHKERKVVLNHTVYPLRLEKHHFGKVRAIHRVTAVEHRKEKRRENFLRMRRKEEVSPYSSYFFNIRVEEQEDSILMVEPYHPVVPRAPSFIQVVKGGKAWIPVANASKQRNKLHAGTLLARYEVIGQAQLEETETKRVGRITEAMGPENDLVEGSVSREEKLTQLVNQKDWSHLSLEQREQVEMLIKNHSKLFIVGKAELGFIRQAPAHTGR